MGNESPLTNRLKWAAWEWLYTVAMGLWVMPSQVTSFSIDIHFNYIGVFQVGLEPVRVDRVSRMSQLGSHSFRKIKAHSPVSDFPVHWLPYAGCLSGMAAARIGALKSYENHRGKQ